MVHVPAPCGVCQGFPDSATNCCGIGAEERKHAAEIADLQLQQAVQAKQIDMFVRLVEASVAERIELKAENAAYRIITGMQRSRQSDENSDK